jgi:hypothetical protein
MTLLEVIKWLDIAGHMIIFFMIIWIVLDLHFEGIFFKLITTATSLLSLFLSITCSDYSKNKFFLVLHIIWEYSIFLCLLLLFFKLKPKLK